MLEPRTASPMEPRAPDEAESIALAYHRAAEGDPLAALVAMARDALSEMAHTDAVILARGRQISHGYVRGRLEA